METLPEPTIRGWGCTPTGDLPASAIPDSTLAPAPKKRGWQRTALFVIVIVLMLMIFLNLALILWVIATLRLSMDSIGPIKIVNGGMELEGRAYITDHLITSSILSRLGQPLTLHSYRNFTVQVSDEDGRHQAKLFIKRDVVQCSGKVFDVTDSRGRSVFRASRDQVRIDAESLTLGGEGGVTIKTAVQTPLVRAPPGFNLELESQTRGLDIRAPQSILLESRAGSIDISSHRDIKLNSIVGAIKIDAPNIVISNLKEAVASDKPSKTKGVVKQRVYQMCACASGKLFLAAPDAPCAADVSDTDLCR